MGSRCAHRRGAEPGTVVAPINAAPTHLPRIEIILGIEAKTRQDCSGVLPDRRRLRRGGRPSRPPSYACLWCAGPGPPTASARRGLSGHRRQPGPSRAASPPTSPSPARWRASTPITFRPIARPNLCSSGDQVRLLHSGRPVGRKALQLRPRGVPQTPKRSQLSSTTSIRRPAVSVVLTARGLRRAGP
jgi:hypothetical protein